MSSGGAGDGGPAVVAEGITKRYGDVTAVDDLDLRVRAGEVYGFLGRNGAGKTTTIRMLVGLVRPTRGRVLVFGRDVQHERVAAAALVGCLVETGTAYPNLTVLENLEVHRRLTRAPRGSVERVVRDLGLTPYARRRAGHLSLGNRQRLALARALLARPRLLVLDEPANGLDPAGIADVRRLLRRLADEEGVTVFVSSHILGEVAQLADRIGILHRGRLVEETTPAAVPAAPRLRVSVDDPGRARAVLGERLALEAVPATGDGGLEVACGAVPPSEIARVLVEAGCRLDAMVPLRDDLEARFLRLTADGNAVQADGTAADGAAA